MRYITVTLNPTVDRMYRLDEPIRTGTLNRAPKMSEVSYSGKGINVSRELLKRGVDSKMLCILRGAAGEDAYKSFIAEGLNPFAVKTEGRLRNNISILDGAGVDTELNESGEAVNFEAVVKFLQLYDRAIEENTDKTVIVSGSAPPGFRNDIYKRLILEAKQKGAYTVLDADGELLREGLEASPHLIKPNERELSAITGCVLSGNENQMRLSALAAASVIYEKTGSEVLCTLGARGSVFAGEEGQFVCPAKLADIKRFKGAGDIYLASFIYERFENKAGIFEAMKRASENTALRLEAEA